MTRILVPPGIGDIFWIMVKLRGFLRAHDLTMPEIWIDAPNDKKRSYEFVQRIPFVTAGGYFERAPGEGPLEGWKRRRGWTDTIRAEAYGMDGRHAFPNVDGFDWFLSYNGSMDAGRSLDEVDPQWPAEWDIPFVVTDGETQYGRELRSRVGPYVVCAFFDAGFYERWLRDLPAAEIYRLLSRIHDETGLLIVLTGAHWDASPVNQAILALDQPHGRILSLIGETTLEQYFGALRFAEGCLGFPAGNTMMGAAFGRPTVIVWNEFFDRRMWRNACPPVANYRPMDSRDGADAIADAFLDLLNRKDTV